MQSSKKTTQGFTLMEAVIGVAISSLLLTALLRFLVAGYPLSRVTYLQANSTETARLQLKRMSQALRELRNSETGAYPLVETQPQRIVFYTDVDNDTVAERIRYELVGNNLERGVIEPTGDPAEYNVANETVTVIARTIHNDSTPLFTYYTGNYPADTTPLTPTDLTEVKYIQFRLIIDANPNADPPPIDVISQVQLRNLKTNLGETVE